MRGLKIIGGLLVLSVLLFLFVANFSAVEFRYECSGTITANGTEKSANAFLKLRRYRWWVGLWSNSSGSAWVELPNQAVIYFSHVTGTGGMFQLWRTPSQFSGNFSDLSGTLGVQLDGFGVFDGTCKGIRE